MSRGPAKRAKSETLRLKKAKTSNGTLDKSSSIAIVHSLTFFFLLLLSLFPFPWRQVFAGKSILVEEGSLHLPAPKEATVHGHVGFDRALLPLERHKGPHPLLLWVGLVNELMDGGEERGMEVGV